MRAEAAARLAHDPVRLTHQRLPEDIGRVFPEGIADRPRRGEEDLDPIEELQDPVPALQRERALDISSGKQNTRRKRLPPESDSACIASGCEGNH